MIGFVEIGEGVEGLIHVSEMSWTKKVKHPSQLVNIGDEVRAMVLDIDQENRRISLGLKQLQANPWIEIKETQSSSFFSNARSSFSTGIRRWRFSCAGFIEPIRNPHIKF